MAPILALIMICLCFGSSFTKNVNTPVVGDWADAVDDGIVRIPLANPHGHSWVLSLRMGTPRQG